MVNNTNEHTRKRPTKQGEQTVLRKLMKIGSGTPYDFQGSHLTPYGGLLPVATMLEKLGFQQLIERHVTIKRLTTSMPGFRFVMAMVLGLYVGWSRLNHLQFLQRAPMLTGILGVEQLPVQSTFWRFLEALHLVVARQLLEVIRRMRQRVWEAAHVHPHEPPAQGRTTTQPPPVQAQRPANMPPSAQQTRPNRAAQARPAGQPPQVEKQPPRAAQQESRGSAERQATPLRQAPPPRSKAAPQQHKPVPQQHKPAPPAKKTEKQQ